jgi:hypothetical protein
MADDLEMLAGHAMDLILEPVLVIGAEPADIHAIVLSEQLANFARQLFRAGVGVGRGVGSEEAAYRVAAGFPRRVAGRHADNVGPFALPRHLVPDGQVGE